MLRRIFIRRIVMDQRGIGRGLQNDEQITDKQKKNRFSFNVEIKT